MIDDTNLIDIISDFIRRPHHGALLTLNIADREEFRTYEYIHRYNQYNTEAKDQA
ncbi:hypothetical protein AbA118F_2171 [Acinetobacter baumannii]|nr:hypothetical protein [Acinetobacter baumannii]